MVIVRATRERWERKMRARSGREGCGVVSRKAVALAPFDHAQRQHQLSHVIKMNFLLRGQGPSAPWKLSDYKAGGKRG